MGKSHDEVIGGNVVVPNSPAARVWLKTLLSYTFGFVCLVWVFHDYDFGDLLGRVAKMNLLLVTMAIICGVLSFVCQGLRWQLLLRPFGSISILRTTQALYTGMFVNQVLPLKLGELLRGYLISRWTAVKLSQVATSIVIERLFDGFWLVAGFVVTMTFIPLPRRLIEAGDALSALVLILIGLLLALSLRRPSLQAFVARENISGVRRSRQRSPEGRELKSVERTLARSLGALLDRAAVELRSILHTPSSLPAFALSLLFVSLQWFAFWLVMLAYGFRLSPLPAAAVFVIVHVGSSVPGAPASIGTYQFFTVVGLVLFGVDKTSAAGFSLVAFVLLSVHICVLGFWALRRSGLTLRGIRVELSKPLPSLKTNV